MAVRVRVQQPEGAGDAFALFFASERFRRPLPSLSVNEGVDSPNYLSLHVRKCLSRVSGAVGHIKERGIGIHRGVATLTHSDVTGTVSSV